MSNEHNPIATIITQLQQKWITEVSTNPQITLVRWLINLQHASIYNGFLKLEATENGKVPEMWFTLLTNFNSSTSHSKDLLLNWIKQYNDNKAFFEAYKKEYPNFNWNPNVYESVLTDDSKINNSIFIKALADFNEALPNGLTLTLALMPYTISSVKDYAEWIDTIAKEGIPKTVKLMVFDDMHERHFDALFDKHSAYSKSLFQPINLKAAINKLAKAGNPNAPEVQFRQCLLEMTKYAEKKNINELKKWGEKGIEVCQKTGLKSMLSNAHIVYAGMLFNFKEFELIEALLQKGLAIAKQGVLAGDEQCHPLVIQYFGFMASCKQLQKKYNEASDLFCKQADKAAEIHFTHQALSAWWMAYTIIRKKDRKRYESALATAYNYAKSAEENTLKGSVIGNIAADYYQFSKKNNNSEHCQDINAFMTSIEDEHWLENAQAQQKAMNERKSLLTNLF